MCLQLRLASEISEKGGREKKQSETQMEKRKTDIWDGLTTVGMTQEMWREYQCFIDKKLNMNMTAVHLVNKKKNIYAPGLESC